MGHINGKSPLLNPTGIQLVTKYMLGVQLTRNIGNLSVSRRRLCSGTEYGLYYWDAANILESELRAVYLLRWRSVEALRRDFLYTTKLESKFILTSYQSTLFGSLV